MDMLGCYRRIVLQVVGCAYEAVRQSRVLAGGVFAQSYEMLLDAHTRSFAALGWGGGA